jgi:hypothetical protein
VTVFEDAQLLPWCRRAIREVVAARSVLDALESQLVITAREQGASWGALAADLGVTRQGARQRHLAVDPVAARRPKPQSAMDAFYAELHAAVRHHESS